MSAWKMLESLLREDKMWRGDSSVRFQDLHKLLDAIVDKGKLLDGGDLHPEGGVITCKYAFDPTVWGKWYPQQGVALAFAATDKDVVAQHAGRPQGSTTVKQNWGGKIQNAPGKARGDFEALPSAMDRYDILMQGEVTQTFGPTGKPKQSGVLFKVAYSPIMGSTDERRARLLNLMSGQGPNLLPRRPQPEVPQPPKSPGNPELKGDDPRRGTFQSAKWFKDIK